MHPKKLSKPKIEINIVFKITRSAKSPSKAKVANTKNTSTELTAPSSADIDQKETIYFSAIDGEYGVFSQSYDSPFTSPGGIKFATAVQYMMYHKARLCADPDSMKKIQAALTPAEAKALGKKVWNYSDDGWDVFKLGIIMDGTYLKFTSTDALRDQLLGTGRRELVNATPGNRVWGIGYAAEDAEANRSDWGENHLGRSLMAIREQIRCEMRGERLWPVDQ
ncbi:N-glycosidase [Lachnellula occidentalis]|uniref:N-glycosidase n=1 Tax=Lachnellula occidentalis TaxID=215460 RepID=A0A8H8S099_9HELO|nr:N-glycosidase [Lachnellula occidentalis]